MLKSYKIENYELLNRRLLQCQACISSHATGLKSNLEVSSCPQSTHATITPAIQYCNRLGSEHGVITGDFFPSNLHNMINYNCKPEKRKLPDVAAWFPSVLYPACAMPAATGSYCLLPGAPKSNGNSLCCLPTPLRAP